jgi:hypothetical protein
VIGGFGPPESDFDTIAAALAAPAIVKDDCRLRVLPGLYSDPLVLDRFVELTAESDDPETTIIDVGGASTAIEIPERSVPGVVLIRGFSIRGSLVIEGGAAIERTRIHGATDVALDVVGAAKLVGAMIVDNPGTAIRIGTSGSLVMSYTTIAGNGLGAHGFSSALAIDHTIVCGNATDVSGVECTTFTLSDVCGSDCSGVAGNINADPLFVNAAAGDYHLSAASPAIDAGIDLQSFTGIPCRDFEGRPRLLDAGGTGLVRSDIGAYEFDSSGQVPGNVPDLRIASWIESSHRLEWDPEPSSSEYHVYRGTLSTLTYDYLMSCLATVAGTHLVLPGGAPPTGDAYFYVVSGDDGVEEGTLGFGSCAEIGSIFATCP